jgi:N-methylhydantoinase B
MIRNPITAEVINNRLVEIARGMERLLFRGAYSTILRESADGSAGVTDANGQSVVTSGYPLHIPSYYYNVQGVLRRYPIDEMREGDSFITSDPYAAGNIHIPDVAIVTPVFVDGRVIAFTVSTGHEPDMGGLVPSSSSPNAREIFHEGIQLPALKYWTNEGIVRDVEALLLSNTRTGETLLGDLRSHVGCTRSGARQLAELCREYGVDTVVDTFDALQLATEEQIREALQSWPDGEAEYEQTLYTEGFDLGHPVTVHVHLAKKGDRLKVDLSRSSEQVRAPINIRPQSTEAGVMLALFAFIDPSIAVNHGGWRTVELINPEGTVTNAQWPAPVNNYHPITHLVYICTLMALNQFVPAQAFGTGALTNGTIAFGYVQDRQGRRSVSYEIMCPSLGATPSTDGTFAATPIAHLVPFTPIEITETEYPVVVEYNEIIPDSGGPGLRRGGVGYRKSYRLESEATFTVRLNPLKSVGWGAHGGQSGPEEYFGVELTTANGDRRALPPTVSRELVRGDSVSMRQTGGGGYGRAFDRSPEDVLEDVLNGYVTVAGAARDYGVVIDESELTLDAEATAAHRS